MINLSNYWLKCLYDAADIGNREIVIECSINRERHSTYQVAVYQRIDDKLTLLFDPTNGSVQDYALMKASQAMEELVGLRPVGQS